MRRVFGSLALIFVAMEPLQAAEPASKRPNVIVVIADDMGYGDLGVHGNPVIKTPNLDRLASEGVRLTRFQVMPVCAPTRACLLTGRYHYRTGVTDTYLGRAMMAADEITLAERLAATGYRTAIFGKWHLGDNAPLRAIDQGFQESLVLKGGGIGQASDPPGGSSYFDPLLQHNGKPERRKGYCSDVYTDAAIDYMTKGPRDTPFFVYLSFNAPHTPLEVPESYWKPYENLSDESFPTGGFPLPSPTPKKETAKVYGMITNIDDNIGRLLAKLDAEGLADNTLIVFLTDNGPQQVRYVGGLRGRKGTVYDGGIRVPCFLRWPGRLSAGRTIDRIAAAIDLTPTVLDACSVAPSADSKYDGVSLWPLLTGAVSPEKWPDRMLFAQWHRGDAPEKFRAFAARSQRFKLVHSEGPAEAPFSTPFQLFDTMADPYEQHDLASKLPHEVATLKSAYSAWFDDVSKTRGYDPVRIDLGSARENPTTLTPQDWRGPRAGNGLGYWEVNVSRAGTYDLTLAVRPDPAPRIAVMRIGGPRAEASIDPKAETVRFEGLTFGDGPARLEAWVEREGVKNGVLWAEVKKRED